MWSSTRHNKSQQLFLGSGGFPQQDKETVTSHGWDKKAMWRLFVSMHMMTWVVKYEVNYLNSFRQFPKGSVSGYCIILYCCTWSQSYEDCLRVWFYRILHHNIEKKHKSMATISFHSNHSTYLIGTKKTQLFVPPAYRCYMWNLVRSVSYHQRRMTDDGCLPIL